MISPPCQPPALPLFVVQFVPFVKIFQLFVKLTQCAIITAASVVVAVAFSGKLQFAIVVWLAKATRTRGATIIAPNLRCCQHFLEIISI